MPCFVSYHLRKNGRLLNKCNAFSLIEIALALGVVAFALVAILGMVPVAVDSALESRRESRAAFIAQTVFTNLRATPFTDARPQAPTEAGEINLSEAATKYLSYGNDGQPVGTIDASEYTNGSSNGNIEFVARLVSTPQLPTPTPTPLPTTNRLSKVELRVETPAAAASANRRSYIFVTLIGE